MNPAFLGTLAEVSAKLFGIFIENWSRSKEKDKKQEKVESWLGKNYENLRNAISSDSAHLLAACEYEDGLSITSARRKLYPKLSPSKNMLELFDKEFHYRMEYLVLLGLLQRGLREYRITRLGVAFLAMARLKRHYAAALKTK